MTSASEDATPRRVLVVDDEPAVGRSLGRLLGSAGFAVSVVAAAKEALESMEREHIDVVLSDIQMPDMSGVELLQKIRAKEPDVPVILMTGNPKVETAAKAVELGALLYLIKPIQPDYLRQMVTEACQRGVEARASRARLQSLPDQSATDPEQDRLSSAFDRAVAALRMHYQPICGAADGTIEGYEALFRSDSKELGNPGTMFPAAEKLNRVTELGRHIRRACADTLPKAPPSALLFVNLHARDIEDPSLLEPSSPLAQYADRVVLEITERAAVGDVRKMSKGVQTLRALGYKIAVDDLGAGYAGLTSFALLEPDFVKLDMSIVRDAHLSELKRKLIGSITTLCREMDIRVVAEGIETTDELSVIRDAGCDLLQGYLLARPGLPFPEITWPDGF